MSVAAFEARREPSRRSVLRDGPGPYLAIDPTSRRRWEPGTVGFAMAPMLVGTIAAQSFAGALIDRVRWKRAATAIALPAGTRDPTTRSPAGPWRTNAERPSGWSR